MAGAVEEILAHAERATRAALLALPQGSWTAVDWLDDDGITTDPVRMQVTVTNRDGTFTVDFAGSAPATTGPVNMPFGGTIACARVAFKAITSPAAQNNHGYMAALDVRAEPGTPVPRRLPGGDVHPMDRQPRRRADLQGRGARHARPRARRAPAATCPGS